MKIQKQQNNLKYEYIEYILPAVCLWGVLAHIWGLEMYPNTEKEEKILATYHQPANILTVIDKVNYSLEHGWGSWNISKTQGLFVLLY